MGAFLTRELTGELPLCTMHGGQARHTEGAQTLLQFLLDWCFGARRVPELSQTPTKTNERAALVLCIASDLTFLCF